MSPNTWGKGVVIPYQVRSYQTWANSVGCWISRTKVVIPYQVRSYQTPLPTLEKEFAQTSRNPLSSQVISNSRGRAGHGQGTARRRNPLSSQVISNVRLWLTIRALWGSCRNPLSSQVISNLGAQAAQAGYLASCRNPLSSQVISNKPSWPPEKPPALWS